MPTHSRESSQVILLGQHVRITVTAVRGQSVRIGVEAPGEIKIHRDGTLGFAGGRSCNRVGPGVAASTTRRMQSRRKAPG